MSPAAEKASAGAASKARQGQGHQGLGHPNVSRQVLGLGEIGELGQLAEMEAKVGESKFHQISKCLTS